MAKPIKINDNQMILQAGAAADIYHQLSLDLFNQVIVQLKKRGTADLESQPYIWQLEKLNDMHLLNEDNVRLIIDRSGVAESALRNVIEREGFKVYQDTKEQLAHDMGKSVSAYNGVQEALVAYASQTFREVSNLINTTLPASVQAVYKGIVEQTVASVITGLKSPQQALNETVMKWFDKGFYGFTDKAGRQWRADVYARNVITSTTYRVYNEMRTQASEEMGVNTYYYSHKAAARPACAELQGKIVTKGAAFTEKGVQVLSLLDHGYGSAGGCLGINCRHTLTPFIIGVNKLPDLPEHLKNITPEQAIENGKKQAQQRAFERDIRKVKERLNVAKQLDYPEMVDKFGKRVKNLQGGLKQLLKDNQFLHRDTVREQGRKAEYLDDVRKNLVVNRQKAYNKLKDVLGNRTPTLKEYGEILLDPVRRKALSHDYRVVKYFQGEIKENLSDEQKKQAVEAYFSFKEQGILFGDHGIARYVERLRRKDGTFTYNYQSVIAIFDKSVNYVSTGRDVRYYNGIMIVTEKGTKNIVTMMKRKKVDKRWELP
ncbi:hypothetical protein RyT2_11480 [Pseudolactococcus yaeyamensis]